LSADSGLEKRLLVLMGARLALSLLSLGIAAALEAAGWSYSPAEWRGFYGTVIFAFVATIGYGLILRRVQRVQRFAVLNIATDIAIVSALVHLSGGSDSPFAFLYVLVGVYGAILLERRGALICAMGGAFVYGGDPGIGVLLSPLGGTFLFIGVALAAVNIKPPAKRGDSNSDQSDEGQPR